MNVTTKHTKTETKTTAAEIKDDSIDANKQVAQKPASRPISEQLAARGVSNEAWHTLTGSVFPGAKAASILLAIDYCKARKLDVLKRPCHIVEMEVERADANGRKVRVRQDVIMPGIYELRTTAHRTGKYLGHTPIEWGPEEDLYGVTVPAWASMEIRRQTEYGIAEFPVIVWFKEVAGTYMKNDKRVLNSKWWRSPRQMTAKCLEAAGLREAFPEEIAGDYVPEEVDAIDARAGGITLEAEPAHVATGANADEMNADLGIVDDSERQAADAAHAAAEGSQEVAQ